MLPKQWTHNFIRAVKIQNQNGSPCFADRQQRDLLKPDAEKFIDK